MEQTEKTTEEELEEEELEETECDEQDDTDDDEDETKGKPVPPGLPLTLQMMYDGMQTVREELAELKKEFAAAKNVRVNKPKTRSWQTSVLLAGKEDDLEYYVPL